LLKLKDEIVAERANLLERIARVSQSANETIILEVGGTHLFKVFKKLLVKVPESKLA